MSTLVNNLLLIDDDEVFRMLCTRSIRRWGIANDILEFDHAKAALDHLQSEDGRTVDAILVDINMPHMDGFEFVEQCENVLANRENAPLVAILSTSAHPRDKQRAQENPRIAEYLVKPIDRSRLVDAISRRERRE